MEASPLTRAAPGTMVTPTAETCRDYLAASALAAVPVILARQDRNPHSPTHGCFDRDYWHHRAIDFPAGSAAEAVLPLALAWSLPLPGSAFHRNAELARCCEAGIRYCARSAHPDGSCDELSPHERCAAAAAAGLVACLDAYVLLGLNDIELLEFFARRADWLARRRPRRPGPTELALTALALHKAGALLASERWSGAMTDNTRLALSMQDKEGWFATEGTGAAGLTFLLGLLAQLHAGAPSAELRAALIRGMDFTARLAQPDGSLAASPGELCPAEYHPHGFEIAGEWLPGALATNDSALDAMRRRGPQVCADFPGIVRRCWSFLLAWRHWISPRPAHQARSAGREYFKHAGLLIDHRDGCELHVSLKRGGAFTFWREGRPVIADSQFSLQLQRRTRLLAAVANHCGRHDIDLDGHTITIRGKLRLTNQARLSTARLILRRMYLCGPGRLLSRAPRGTAWAAAAPGASVPFRFSRTLTWENGRLRVTDELRAKKGWDAVQAIAIRCTPAAAIDAAPLEDWLDLGAQMHTLAPGDSLRVERTL